MEELKCPYCNKFFMYDNGDCELYTNDDGPTEIECHKCEKYFIVTSHMSWSFTSYKADCLNGAGHRYEKHTGTPKGYFIGEYVCKDCGKETQIEKTKKLGEYVSKLKTELKEDGKVFTDEYRDVVKRDIKTYESAYNNRIKKGVV